MSDFTVAKGTPILVFSKLDPTRMERRELKREAELDRADILWHAFAVGREGDMVMLVPASMLQLKKVAFPPPTGG